MCGQLIHYGLTTSLTTVPPFSELGAISSSVQAVKVSALAKAINRVRMSFFIIGKI